MPLPEGGNLGGLGSTQAPLNFASKLFLPQQIASTHRTLVPGLLGTPGTRSEVLCCGIWPPLPFEAQSWGGGLRFLPGLAGLFPTERGRVPRWLNSLAIYTELLQRSG